MGQKSFGVWCGSVLVLGLLTLPVDAQILSIGLKGGVPLNDALNTPLQPSAALTYIENTHRLVLGPSVEVRLGQFGIELDALHKSFDYRLSSANAGQSPGVWEFPLLAKFRIIPGVIQPYVEGGFSFSRLTNVQDLIALKNRSSKGLVIGGGVELRLGIVRISPEIRYSNWLDRNLDIAALQSRQNQMTFLVGFTFH